MDLIMILLKQILIMFILIGIGFVLCKKKFISLTGSGEIGKILLNLVIPVVIINSFWVTKTPEKTMSLLHTVIVSVIVMAVSVIVSTLIFGKKNGVACFSSAFSNAGFIGIPLVQAVVGSEAVSYISVMIVLVNLLQWTYGIYIMTGDVNAMKPKTVLKNPVFLSVVIGLLFYFLSVPKITMAETLISSITAINTPLAMFVSGVYLAQSDLLSMIKKKDAWKVSIVRLAVIPVITIAVLKMIPFGSMDLRIAILLAAACPVGSNVAIFAQQYNCSYTDAVEQVCMSTMLCLITIPAVIAAATAIL